MSEAAGTARSDVWRVSARPALPTAVLFMLGIALHARLPHWPIAWAVLLAICVVAAAVLFRRAMVCSIVIAVGCIACAIALAQLVNYHYPANHIGHFATEAPRLAQLELHIDHAPRVLTQPPGSHRAMPPKQVLTARVTRAMGRDGWIDTSGSVLVQIGEPHPQLAINQRIRAIGMLQRPGPAMNPGQFDWAGYYREQRVIASLQIPHADNLLILQSGSPGLIAQLREQARLELARGFAARDSLDHALLRALLLGDHDPELRDVQEQFRRTGTSHHLAISGMHVAVLTAVVFGICRLLRLTPRLSCIIAMLFVVLYGTVALPSPPVVRSVLLCMAFGIGILSRRSIDPIQLLALTVLLMLIYHPMDLFNAGFQLSFGTVLGLMIFPRRILHLVWREDADARVLRSLRLQTRRQVVSYWARRRMAAITCAAVVAWLVSMPLVARHFEQLNPWAILASILMAPVVFLSLIGGFLKVILTMLWPSFSTTWASLAAAPVAWMRQFVDVLALLPGSDVPLPAPSITLIVLFYLLLALPLLPLSRPIFRRFMRCGPATACLMVPLVALQVGFARPAPPRESLRITILAVGAGQCAVVQAPNGSITLIDAGSISLADPLRKCIAPFIRHQGRRTVQRLILSHSDYDHLSAAHEVVAAYDVRQILIGPQFATDALLQAPAELLLERLRQMERQPQVISQSHALDIGGAELQVLWPPPHVAMSSNNHALVMRLSYGGRTVLFPGDIQDPAMGALLEAGTDLRADLLIGPHHGSAERLTEAFVNAVAPRLIVSSSDRTPSMKQRYFDVLAGATPHLRTNHCGAITITMAPEGVVRVERFLPGVMHVIGDDGVPALQR